MDTAKSTWIIGGAVIFAGLLIAAGVFFGDTASTGSEGAGNDLMAASEAAGVSGDELETCLANGDFQSDVQTDLNNAGAAGGQGTPYNVLALNDPLSETTRSEISDLFGENLQISEDGKRIAISGAVPYNGMTQIIDRLLDDPQSEADTATSDDIAINPIDESDHIRGNLGAQVTIVEYSDFFCPFCADFHQTMKQVIDTYSGDEVAWVYRHFPIPQLPGHQQAPRYAQASECVADIGGSDAFWSFADHIFANQ